ncbi:HET-domain-containing protein, partial [Coniophora puteana RWD-64-598 SS2]
MRRIARNFGHVFSAGSTLSPSESLQSTFTNDSEAQKKADLSSSSLAELQAPATGPLCEVCSDIDFHTILRDGVSQHNPVPYDLLTSVLERAASPGRCAFCSLVGDLIRRVWLLDTPECAGVDLSGITLSLFAITCGHVLGPPPQSEEDERDAAHRIHVEFSRRPAEIGRAAGKTSKTLSLEVQLMQEDAHAFGRERVLHGRRVGDVVDMELVKTWARICKTQHGERCRAPWWAASALREDLPKEVRVLDVQKLMLVPASTPVGYRYLALSYVWGSPDICNHGSYWTTSANLEERMSKEGSVLHEKLPAAITDAILTTRTLGERYLWIDALCIAQDSWDDKKIQINVMDRIFLRAAITIFATSSASSGVVSSAAAPLPGLRPGTREVAQKVRVVKGLHLCTPLPRAPEALSQTTWNTRGWTYQEMMLATRRLVFTPDQVFFQCFED